jgi:hypothetical protein
VAALAGGALALGLLTVLDSEPERNSGTSAGARPAPEVPVAEAPARKVPTPTAPALTALARTTPDEEVVLLLARVRDDATVGAAGPRLLRLLRGLDAEHGAARTALATRTLQFAEQQVRFGRLRADVGARTAVTMRRVLAEAGEPPA